MRAYYITINNKVIIVQDVLEHPSLTRFPSYPIHFAQYFIIDEVLSVIGHFLCPIRWPGTCCVPDDLRDAFVLQ